MRNNTNRIKSFDGLKGFSILMVIFYHLFPKYIPGGFLMVNTFLVLSGYFFAYKMEKIMPIHKKFDYKAILSYIKTTFERVVLPLIWMLLVIVVGFLIFQPKELHYIRNDLLSSAFFVNNWQQILSDKSYFVKMTDATPLTHLWYNSIYLQSFLLAIPLMLFTRTSKMSLPQKGAFWLIIVAISHALVFMLYQPGADPSRVYYGLDTRFSSFALGIATAYSLPSLLNTVYGAKHKQLIFRISGVVVTILTIALVAIVTDTNDLTYYLVLPTFNFISMFLIWLITINPPATRFFWGNPFFEFLGKRSYNYYLWYYPVIVFMMAQFRRFDGNMLLINCLSILLIGVLGELFYHLVERAAIFIPFGNRWRSKPTAKENYWMPEKLKRNKWISLVSLGIFAIAFFGLIYGMVTAKNEKRVSLMELEYQTYRFAPNLLNEPFPGTESMIKVDHRLKAIDQSYNTSLVTNVRIQDSFDKLLSDYQIAKENERIVGQLVNMKVEEIQAYLAKVENSHELYDEVAQNHPIVSETLSKEEMLFASEVPMTLFGDSIVNINGINTLEVFKSGNYFGKGSLQIWGAIPIYKQMIADGEVQENVVINLGTNGSMDRESLDEMIKLSGDRNIFFINTNSKVQHIQEVNNLIKDVDKAYDNVYEIDWHSYQSGHPEWYGEDEIHHSIEGMEHFTIVIAKTMFKDLKK